MNMVLSFCLVFPWLSGISKCWLQIINFIKRSQFHFLNEEKMNFILILLYFYLPSQLLFQIILTSIEISVFLSYFFSPWGINSSRMTKRTQKRFFFKIGKLEILQSSLPFILNNIFIFFQNQLWVDILFFCLAS